MNLRVKTLGIFLGVSKTEYTNRETGKKGCYYNLAVKQGGEVGSLPCNEDLYTMYERGEIKDFTEVELTANFNDRFNRLQVTSVQPKK